MNIGGAGGRRRVTAPSAKDGRRDREDELALFREMIRREKARGMSLLQPVSDEFEPNDGFYPLHRDPSGKKGLAHDLLPAEGEKNDYDWLKTPPATPLFPSLEMEAGNPRLIIQREIPFLQPPRPSRFAGKREEPKPINRQKSPAPGSIPSSRTTHPTPAANSLQMVESKTGAERGRRPSPGATRGRTDVAQQDGETNAVVGGGTQVGNLILGSRMVEKVVKARSAAAAGGGGGGGDGKVLKPKERGPKQPSSNHWRLPSQSPHDTGMKRMVSSGKGTRRKPASGHQEQNEGHPKSLAPQSNASSSASTPRTPPGHGSREDRNLLKKGVGRHKCAMC